ncbi:histidinol-phosphate transaminase [Candidatus Micrarchaeota archaeon]|nr:histidinol-phosphate transaminase [Candidatus Micrarchaeota archaeon]MBU1165592.1 histidinol-phosphate transaminase [Candidatus Micrarchaeota archaeon]MBU1887403.1 histidinol-phosphate transaminase [Candidatus Micrarchaeota archaeon]
MIKARKVIEELAPYAAPKVVEADVKLNQNESPYDMPLELREEIRRRLATTAFNRYNNGTSQRLRELLAKKFNTKADQIIVGAGMDELLYYLILAFVDKGDKIVRSVPSFSMYEICAKVTDANDKPILLSDNFELTEEFVRESNAAKLVFICTPNNPTSNSFDKKTIEKIIQNTDGLVCIDEAYAEFAEQDCLDFLKYENVIIFRTFSKAYSCAGVRLGYAIANPQIIDRLNRVRLPWNLNFFAQIVGEVVLENESIFIERIAEIKKERKRLISLMKSVVELLPSDCNFITFKVANPNLVFAKLLKNGILVRNISKYPKLENYLRVNVGTRQENNAFLKALKIAVTTGQQSQGQSKGIIFDIDGVLVDVTKSYREAIKQTVASITGKNITNKDIEEIKKLPNSNNDWDVTYALITGIKDLKNIGRTNEQYKKAKDKFQELYLDGLRDQEEILISKETLTKLKQKGYKLGIVTSRPREEALYVLKQFTLEFFSEDCIIAQEDCEKEKPNPDPLLLVKQRMNCVSTIYVGDTINDRLATRAAKMRYISVTEDPESDSVISNVNQILEVLE